MIKDSERLYDYSCDNDNIKVTIVQKGCNPGFGRLLHHAFRRVDICDHETGEVVWGIYECANFYQPTATVAEVLEDF